MSFDSLIREALGHINDADWSSSGFELRKAYVCAIFSELAYQCIQDHELKNAKRVTIIPCFAYQNAVRQGRAEDFNGLMASLDFGQFFVVNRRYAVVVGVKTAKVIIIAIRGTTDLYDWLVNLRASKHTWEGGAGAIQFHKGFFRAIWACLEPASVEVHKFFQSSQGATPIQEPIPIYITGHSLGGALSAIMFATWSIVVSRELTHEGRVHENRIFPHAGYTFGMPRYGDLRAVSIYRTPYHLYNDRDIVPTVPPRWLGFDNCFSEFQLDGTSIENISQREGLKFVNWISRLVSGRGVSNHAIELY